MIIHFGLGTKVCRGEWVCSLNQSDAQNRFAIVSPVTHPVQMLAERYSQNPRQMCSYQNYGSNVKICKSGWGGVGADLGCSCGRLGGDGWFGNNGSPLKRVRTLIFAFCPESSKI